MRSIENRLLLKGRKNKKTIITILLALVTMTGQAQTKTATISGYSPSLKDGTLVLAAVGNIGNCWHSRGDRHLGYSSRHTQVPVPATTVIFRRNKFVGNVFWGTIS